MKQMETITVKVGENTFYITKVPAMTAANVFGQLTNFVMPVLGSFGSLVGKGDGSALDLNIEEAIPSLTLAASCISGAKLEELMMQLLIRYNNVAVEDRQAGEAVRLNKILADEIFCGETQDMFLLAVEVVKTNYSGFFKKLTDRFGPVFSRLTALANTINTVN